MKTTLQTLTKYSFKTPTLSDNDVIYYSSTPPLPIEWCDEVARSIKHRGWFDNDEGESCKDGSGIIRGFVANLPASPGFPEGRYLAGYYVGGSDCWVVNLELYNDDEEAAQVADGMAENLAEREREHGRRWRRAADLDDAIGDAKIELSKLLALRNHPKFPEVRGEIPDLIEQIRTNQEELETLRDVY